jgi:hypothetical protein
VTSLPEHNFIALGLPPIAVGGGIALAVGFGLDDLADKPSASMADNEEFSEEVSGDLEGWAKVEGAGKSSQSWSLLKWRIWKLRRALLGRKVCR